jgi:hypothetical protein
MQHIYQISLIVLLSVPLLLDAQKHDYIWLNGSHDHQGLGDPHFSYSILNFSDSSKLMISNKKFLNATYKNSIHISLFNPFNIFMSSDKGELLWYSNGMRIFNRHHEFMYNGDSINYGQAWVTYNLWRSGYEWYDSQAVPLQSMMSDRYVMMHTLLSREEGGYPINLMYSLIDMQAQNGDGEVLLKNKDILQDTISPGGFIRHANGKDWWFLAPYLNHPKWQIGLVNDRGLNMVHQLNFDGSCDSTVLSKYLATSPDGETVILISNYGYSSCFTIFDFDRCEGQLTLRSQFTISDENIFVFSAVVSPNNRFLYFLNHYSRSIMQCDLEAKDVAASRQLISIEDGKWAPFPGGYFKMGLAPDDKIYIANGSSNFVLSVINKPDLPGPACDVFQDLFIPCYNAQNVPRNPNYRLGATSDGDACPTKFFTSGPAGVTVKLAPQGGWRMYTDKSQLLPEGPLTFVLLDLDGTTIHCTKPFYKKQFSLALTDCDPQPGMEWYLYQDFATFARGIID